MISTCGSFAHSWGLSAAPANEACLRLLQLTPLFSGLGADDYLRLASSAKSKRFERGEVIFTQGAMYRRLVLLDSGCVKLTLLRESGREVIVAMRGKREVLDLSSGLSETHSCTARAVTGTVAMTLPVLAIRQMMRERPAFGENVYRILGAELHSLQTRYHEVSSEQVAQRLALTLMRLARQFGVQKEGGVELNISREELAQIAGTTLFTASRLVSDWAKSGVVQSGREVVLIRSASELRRLGTATDDEPSSLRSAGL